MERSLDPALLGAALGATSRLPSPEELAATISEAEISLLLGRGEVVPDLVRLGWFLHSVGSAIPSLELYGWKTARRVSSRGTHTRPGIAGHWMNPILSDSPILSRHRLHIFAVTSTQTHWPSIVGNSCTAYLR